MGLVGLCQTKLLTFFFLQENWFSSEKICSRSHFSVLQLNIDVLPHGKLLSCWQGNVTPSMQDNCHVPIVVLQLSSKNGSKNLTRKAMYFFSCLFWKMAELNFQIKLLMIANSIYIYYDCKWLCSLCHLWYITMFALYWKCIIAPAIQGIFDSPNNKRSFKIKT